MDFFNFLLDEDLLLNKYRDAFSKFENYLKEIYSYAYSCKEHRGYLINLNDYNAIKKIVFNKNNRLNPRNIPKINQIEIKTPIHLIGMILNKNQFIFINTELWLILCDKIKRADPPIMYTIAHNNLTFNLDNQELYFKADNNFINIKTFNLELNYNKNISKIKQIRNAFHSYYLFEDKISKDLKSKNFSINKAFLVNKAWIDEWIKYSGYDIVINNQQDILKNLIYYFELKSIINEMNVYKLNTKREFEIYLENNHLALIDSNCILYLNNDFSQKYINYCAFNNKIHIYLDNNEILSFNSNNNIISSNRIINYSIHLKQLIKIFFFQKNFNEILNHKSFYNKIYCAKDIYLINKNVISKYKNIFKYQKLKDFLERNKNTQNINYLNLQKYYPIIFSELEYDFINQIEQKKVFKEFRDIKDFIELEYKVNPSSEIVFKYITDFEIIDENIKKFFIKYGIVKEENFISCSYIVDSGKILIMFNKNNKNFYEIGQFNKNNDFIIEILIDEIKKENKSYIITYFLENGIDLFITHYAIKPQSKITFEVISQSLQSNLSYLLQIQFLYYKIKVSQIEKGLNSQKSNENIINNNDDIKNSKYMKSLFY